MIKWVIYISLLCFAHYANSQWHHLTVFNSGNDTLNIQDFHFFNANEGVLLARRAANVNRPNRSYILKTTDGAITWDTIQVYTDTVLVALSFPSENVGYIGAVNPMSTTATIEILKTTDGGQNWIDLPNNGINKTHMIHTLYFYNEEVGIVSRSGYSWITYDGGLSWSEITTNPFGGAPFTNLNEGVFVGVGGALLLYSEDTCQNFHVDTIFWGGSANAVDYNAGNFYVSISGNNGNDLGYPYFNFGIIARKTRGLDNLKIHHLPEFRTNFITSSLEGVYVGTTDLIGNNRHIIKSEDEGNTWWSQEIINLNEDAWLGIRKIQCLDNYTCIAGDSKSLYKTTNGGGPLIEQVGQLVYSTPQEEEEENPDTAFLLYPNPFTNELKIESDQEILTIQITDLNGRLVYSGTHNTKIVTLETVFLSTAVYIITIEKAEETIRRKVVKW